MAMLASLALLVGLAPTVQADETDWPERLSLGVANPGGTYFAYGRALAGLLRETLDLPIELVPTGGPVQNATLVQIGELDVGLVTLAPAHAAWIGEGALAPGLRHTALRALFPMYQTPFQILVLEDSDLHRLADLQGRTVGVGPAGGTSGTYWPALFAELGLRVSARHGTVTDLTEQLAEGLIDAFAFAAGPPVPAFLDLAARRPVRLISVTEEEQGILMSAVPGLVPYTLAGETYPGIDDDTRTVSMWNVAVAHADLPDSLAHAITAIAMEQGDRLAEAHPAAAETVPENHRFNTVLPWHPGAARWFAEHGQPVADPPTPR